MRAFFIILALVTVVALSQTREVVNVGAFVGDTNSDTGRSGFVKLNNNDEDLFQFVYTNKLLDGWRVTNMVGLSLNPSLITTDALTYVDTDGVLSASDITITKATQLATSTNSLQPQLDARAVQVATLTDLISLDAAGVRLASTAGYHTQGDGGAGTYRWADSLPSGVSTNRGAWLAGSTGFWSLVHDGSINVKQFGAKGDGATDDFAALLSAAHSVTNEGAARVVFYPSGVYALATAAVDFELRGPATHIGDGKAWVKLLERSATGGAVVMRESASGVTIDNLHIDGNNITGQNGFGIADYAADIIIRNCRVKNLNHSAFPGGIGGGRAFSAQHAVGGGARRIVFDNCQASNCYQAFDVSGRLDSSGVGVYDQSSDGIRVINSFADNCQVLISVQGRGASYPHMPQTLSAIFSNIQGRDVGLNTSYPTNRTITIESWGGTNLTSTATHVLVWGDKISFQESFGNVVSNTTYYVRNYTSSAEFSLSASDEPGESAFDVGSSDTGSIVADVALYYNAPIRFDRAANVILDNIQIYNDKTNYAVMDAVILGKAHNVVGNVSFSGRVKTVFDGRTWSETTNWAADGSKLEKCNLTAFIDAEPWTVVMGEDGSAKIAGNRFAAYVPSVRWGIVNRPASLHGAGTTLDVTQTGTGKRRFGLASQLYTFFNDFSGEAGSAGWNGAVQMGLFDAVITGATNVAFGSLYHGGNVYIRRNGTNEINLEEGGGVRFPNSAWNGGRLLKYGTTRFFIDVDTLKFKTGADPANSADGRTVAAKTQVNLRVGGTTFRVLTHAPVQVFALTGNSTVTMSTDNALAGDTASIVRPGTEAFTLNVGPDIKTIASGVAATVDLIYDGTDWIIWRYTAH